MTWGLWLGSHQSWGPRGWDPGRKEAALDFSSEGQAQPRPPTPAPLRLPPGGTLDAAPGHGEHAATSPAGVHQAEASGRRQPSVKGKESGSASRPSPLQVAGPARWPSVHVPISSGRGQARPPWARPFLQIPRAQGAHGCWCEPPARPDPRGPPSAPRGGEWGSGWQTLPAGLGLAVSGTVRSSSCGAGSRRGRRGGNEATWSRGAAGRVRPRPRFRPEEAEARGGCAIVWNHGTCLWPKQGEGSGALACHPVPHGCRRR